MKFDALFRLEEISASLKLSSIYLKKVNQWLHNDKTLIEKIRKQVNRINYLIYIECFFFKAYY